tara:strand:- start:495 stop:776 length:282 start_codon:yes stop_codon:yes gene_type:complete
MDHKELIHKAADLITNDRQKDYGDIDDNYKKFAAFLNIFFEDLEKVKPSDAALIMVLLKISRIKPNTFNEDTFADAIGYLGIASALRKKELGD